MEGMSSTCRITKPTVSSRVTGSSSKRRGSASTPRGISYSRDRLFAVASPLWLTSSGAVPTRSFFLARLRLFVPDMSVAGQSLRAGGATFLAELRVPEHLIQACSRWSSKAFKIYIRKHPKLLQNLLFAQHKEDRLTSAQLRQVLIYFILLCSTYDASNPKPKPKKKKKFLFSCTCPLIRCSLSSLSVDNFRRREASDTV